MSDTEPAAAVTPRTTFATADVEPGVVARLITGSVVPRPIGWVGSIRSDGAPNLAPFSFYNAVSTTPPVIMFSTSLHSGAAKDTLVNVRDVPEFTVSLTTGALGEQMNATAASLPHGNSEFDVAGLTPEWSDTCRAPAVAASPIVLECSVDRFVEFLTDDGGEGSVVTFGRVTHVRVDPAVLESVDGEHPGRIAQHRLDAIGRMGGPIYTRTNDQFAMGRPR